MHLLTFVLYLEQSRIYLIAVFFSAGCDDPGIPSNGKRRGSHFTVRKRLYFSCDRGFRLIGERHIQCQSNLQWSGKIPTCKRKNTLLITWVIY